MIKAIFFDVDGTLVPGGGQTFSPRTLAALNTLRKQGVALYLCTGRHISMLDGLRAQFEFDGYATVNGQFCLCKGETVHKNPIPTRGLEELIQAADRHGFSCIFLEGEGCRMTTPDAAAEQFLSEFRVARPPVIDVKQAVGREVYQVIVLLDQEREHLLLDTAHHLSATRWHPLFLDAMAPGGGKDKGVQAILSHTGVSHDEAMALGDGANDIPMLQAVGMGVAMGNATQMVKEHAGWVTGHVDEDGLVQALKHFGLLSPDF